MIIAVIFLTFMFIAYCVVRGGTHQELPEIKEKNEQSRKKTESEV